MQRILIIQTAFLGDVILATSFIASVHHIFPDAKIDVLVKKGNESLLTRSPLINKIYTFDKSNGKWKGMFALIKGFRREKYDYVFNLQRFASSGIIAVLSGAKKVYGFAKNPFSFLFSKRFPHDLKNGKHELFRNFELLKEFGLEQPMPPQLFPSIENYNKVELFKTERYYCLAPASVWETKRLPAEKWVELIERLPLNSMIYLLGSKTDEALCELIANSATANNVVNLAGALNLLDSAALMKDATRNYVNDSGPLHIASAMNAPVTAFFCSTIPAFGFGPTSDDSQIVEVSNLSCRPCGIHGHKKCPQGHFSCGHDINILGVKF